MAMKIIFGSQYRKQYKKLAESDKEAVKKTISVFSGEPFDRRLRNHPLKGEFSGLRSISAGFDLRIIFREEDSYAIVEFIQVGSHSDLYE